MSEPIPTMKVRVGNRGDTGSYEGVRVTTVIWHRGLTEAEAEEHGALEVWAFPS
jgi:hypothetical protein